MLSCILFGKASRASQEVTSASPDAPKKIFKAVTIHQTSRLASKSAIVSTTYPAPRFGRLCLPPWTNKTPGEAEEDPEDSFVT